MPSIRTHRLAKLAADSRDEVGYLQTYSSFHGERFVLEDYQKAFLSNRARFRCVNKSRQVGISLTFGAEALARCQLNDGYTAVIISYNQRDAKEKIHYARDLYHSLPLGVRKKMSTDSTAELAFAPLGKGRGQSRIISLPCKGARGAHDADVYFDEFAHYPKDREVYRASAAAITRGPTRQFTVASTPLGARGMFHAVATNSGDRYGRYSRQRIPWWLSAHFCVDVHTAAREAHRLTTAERIERFGTEAIREQFDIIDLDAFGEEFECKFSDESQSYYPLEIIQGCTAELPLPESPQDIKPPTGALVAGYDVGRFRDASELSIFERRKGHFHCVYLRTFRNTPFAEQEGELRRVLNLLPIERLSIDSTGLGLNLAENLERDYECVVREHFTMQSKARWCSSMKIMLQKRGITIPNDRDIIRQFHSIRRKVSPSGNLLFDGERTKSGHCDKFWSMAIACQSNGVEDNEAWGIGVNGCYDWD